MKRAGYRFIRIFLLLTVTHCGAAEQFQTLETVHWIGTLQTNFGLLRQESATACRLPGEGQPSDDYPDGNWGFPAEGFQMSLRLEKASFQIGEPVVVSLLVRNVTTNTMEDGLSLAERAEFLLTNQRREALVRRDIFRPDATAKEKLRAERTKGWGIPLPPGTQRKFKMILSEVFDLSVTGTYFVTVKRNCRTLDGKNIAQLSSGTALFRILDTSRNQTNATKAVTSKTKAASSPGQALPPSDASPASASVSPAGTALAFGDSTQHQTHTTPSQPIPKDVKPVETGNEPPSLPRRNLLRSGALAGLVLIGVLGLWLLRRRKA